MKKLVLRLAVGYTNLTTGTRLTDAHNGLRLMSRDVVERLDITQNRMAHASELVAQIGEMKVPLRREPGAHPLHRLLEVQGPVPVELRQHPRGADVPMNAVVVIQVLLIVVVVLVVARLFRSRGARAQAIRRIGLVVFAAFAAVSILFPDVWTSWPTSSASAAAPTWCSTRLVVAFLSFTVTTYLRFRDLETNYTRLARRIALSEAPRPSERNDDPAA